MAGKVLQLKNVVTADQLAAQITQTFQSWDDLKRPVTQRWKEVQQYVYATDTTQTSNNQLPWNNKTTIPKLCQIRDNLQANYMASIFPRRKWLVWEADNQSDQDMDKTSAIKDYMAWVIDQPDYKKEVNKLIGDYLDTGNCFSMPEWYDGRVEIEDRSGIKTQVGYVGPKMKRISPYDIVFDPTASTFEDSPKIIRSLVTLGEAADVLQKLSTTEDEKIVAQELINNAKTLRSYASDYTSIKADSSFDIFGFGSYRDYLLSGYVELLSFYGDIYDLQTGDLLKNYQIVVFDRLRVAYKKPNPSYFGRAPVYHSGWRKRADNLWAMGPLENLVGMQYRIDHVENMKADLFDLTAFPPIKRKGYVEDYTWGPMAEIVVGNDGDVTLMTPNTNIVQFNQELQQYLSLMEEMAGAPAQSMGIRSPGEKTAYEVQTLENSIGRIYQNKISQFEEEQMEQNLNAMLELARRLMDETVVRVIDDEFKFASFRSLTPQDITGSGRIKPLAARHFAEKAEMLQNVTQFFSSKLGQIVLPHTSAIKLSTFAENVLELDDWQIFQPNIAITEQADSQKLVNAHQEDIGAAAQTPAGLAHGDVSSNANIPPEALAGPPGGAPSGPS